MRLHPAVGVWGAPRPSLRHAPRGALPLPRSLPRGGGEGLGLPLAPAALHPLSGSRPLPEIAPWEQRALPRAPPSQQSEIGLNVVAQPPPPRSPRGGGRPSEDRGVHQAGKTPEGLVSPTRWRSSLLLKICWLLAPFWFGHILRWVGFLWKGEDRSSAEAASYRRTPGAGTFKRKGAGHGDLKRELLTWHYLRWLSPSLYQHPGLFY